jgi:hypothetical protein
MLGIKSHLTALRWNFGMNGGGIVLFYRPIARTRGRAGPKVRLPTGHQ